MVSGSCGILMMGLGSGWSAWTGEGEDNFWANGDNWSGGTIPGASDNIILGDDSSDAAQSIDLNGATVILENRFTLNNSTNRSYTISNGGFTFHKTGANFRIVSGDGTGTFTIDAPINTTTTGTTNTLTITGEGARTINLMQNITSAGQLSMDAPNVRLNLHGDNTFGTIMFVSGEIVVYHQNALGLTQFQSNAGTGATISLASDLNFGGGSTSTFLRSNIEFRIREEVSGNTNRVVNFHTRVAAATTGVGGPNAKLSIVENINSTGRVILNFMNNSGANAQNLAVDLGSNGILRFSNTGNTKFGRTNHNNSGSAIISGNGDVEFTGGGTTTIESANVYTGTTTLTNNSKIILSSVSLTAPEEQTYHGSLSGTSAIHLTTVGTSLSIAGLTLPSYTLEEHQTLTGIGSVIASTSTAQTFIVDGTLSPGNEDANTLVFNLGSNGILQLGESSQFVFELGSVSDLVNVTSGALDIGNGTLAFSQFDFQESEGFALGEYILFSTGKTILGSLSANVSGVLGNGHMGTLRIDGNNLLVEVGVIPEPGVWVLLFFGLCVPFFHRRTAC